MGLGLVTALLTAYYMSRQVYLVFKGEERWKKAARPETPADAHAEPPVDVVAEPVAAGGAADHDELVTPQPVMAGSSVTSSSHGAAAHGAHGDFKPHESPRIMTIPLIVLAVLAAFGGLLNLPFTGWLVLEHWLEPVFGHNLHHVTSSGGTKVALAATAVAAALVGVLVAAAIYRRHRIAESAVEPRVLQRAWFVDELYQKVIAHPGRALSQWLASVFDAKVIDGAVNGVAALVRGGGTRLRTVQSGFVRSYALAVALGAVGILLFAVLRSA